MTAGSFLLDGEAVPFRTGDTVASALMRAGRLTLRTARSGEPRGVFCGIGVCQECLLTVDGRPNIRACVTAARPGLVAASRPAAR